MALGPQLGDGTVAIYTKKGNQPVGYIVSSFDEVHGHFAELIVGLASKISAPVSLAKHKLIGQKFAFPGTYASPIVADKEIRTHLGVKGGAVIDRWRVSSKDIASVPKFVDDPPRTHQFHEVCGAKDLQTKKVIALWCVHVQAKILSAPGELDRPIFETSVMLATTTDGTPGPDPTNPRADLPYADVVPATSSFYETGVTGISKAGQFEALVQRTFEKQPFRFTFTEQIEKMPDGTDGLPFTELDDTVPDSWWHPPALDDEDAGGGGGEDA